MIDALLLLLAGVASYAGFSCFALAMPVHWEQVGQPADGHAVRGRRLRLTGAFLLCVAAGASLWRDGPGFGILLGALLMSAGGIAVALTLAWCPGVLGWFAGRRGTP